MPGDLNPKIFRKNHLAVLVITLDDPLFDLRTCTVTNVHYKPFGETGFPWAFIAYHPTSATHATLVISAALSPPEAGGLDVPDGGPTGELTVNLQNNQGKPVPISAPIDTGP